MKRWQSEHVARNLDEALAGMSKESDTALNREYWLDAALTATRAGLNEKHRQQIDILLRQARRQRQRGY